MEGKGGRVMSDKEEAFEEQAAIMEFEAGMSREEAEAKAKADVEKKEKSA